MKGLALLAIVAACLGCGVFGPDGRYHPRDKRCVVRTLSGAPKGPVIDLGIVTVDCWTGDNDGCMQELLDEVCRRRGDIIWDLGGAAPSTSKLTARVARSRPAAGDGG